MDGVVKGMLFVLLVLYILSPVDMCPGPIDDLLLAVVGIAYMKGKE